MKLPFEEGNYFYFCFLKNILFIFFIAFSIVGCDKQQIIKFPLPYDGDILVLQAILSEQEGIEAYVTHTVRPDQQDRTPETVEAELTVFENGEIIDTLNHNIEGYYCSSINFLPKYGSNYSILVKAPGFKDILTPVQTILPPIYFDEVKLISGINSEYRTLVFQFSKSSIKSIFAYGIRVVYYDEDGLFLTQSHEKINPFGFILSNNFVSDTYSNSLEIGMLQRRVGNLEFEKVGSIDLQLIVYSQELVRYMETIVFDEGGRYDPYSLPVPIYSNIENGVGIFGSFAYSVESFQL